MAGMPAVAVTAPSPAQIALYTDARGKVLEGAYHLLGLGLPSETGTLAALEAEAYATILGDGTNAHPGLGHAKWQSLVADSLMSASIGARYDALFARQAQLMRVLDDLVQSSLPSGSQTGWRFASPRPFDAYLTRLNATVNAPATPASAGVLTAIQTGAGALPNTVSGSAPRILHTLVGASDEIESLPSAEATRVAIAAANNAYSYQIAGTVPTGIRKVRIYRTVYGAAGAPYGWDSDVLVTPGTAYPAIAILQPDPLLRMDWQPPAWMQCPIRPSAAALYALAFASSIGGGARGASPTLSFNPSGMISPGNVLLNSADGFLGVGNPAQSAVLSSSSLTGLLVSATVAGGVQQINSSDSNLQGYAGAMGLRARCTVALNGTAIPMVTITYWDATHGWGVTQTTGGLTPSTAFAAGAVGDTAIYSIPAGQLIQSVTETSVTGTATTGSWIYEAVFPR